MHSIINVIISQVHFHGKKGKMKENLWWGGGSDEQEEQEELKERKK